MAFIQAGGSRARSSSRICESRNIRCRRSLQCERGRGVPGLRAELGAEGGKWSAGAILELLELLAGGGEQDRRGMDSS